MLKAFHSRSVLDSSLSYAPWLAFLAGVALLVAGSLFAAERALVWKASDNALLRVDDRPVNDWNVYQSGKKNDPLLLQMGKRFLLIEVRERLIFEIAPVKIEHKGAELLFDPNDRPAQPLDTSDWIVKDVGLAYRFSTKLTAEMHVVDVQIPHPLDLRSIH
jgi:hypothetical protein